MASGATRRGFESFQVQPEAARLVSGLVGPFLLQNSRLFLDRLKRRVWHNYSKHYITYFHSLKHKGTPKKSLTALADLAPYKAAITEALYKGTKHNIKSEINVKKQ